MIIVRYMRFAWWITKATDTHSDYLIRVSYPRQHWLRESAQVLLLYLNLDSYRCDDDDDNDNNNNYS